MKLSVEKVVSQISGITMGPIAKVCFRGQPNITCNSGQKPKQNFVVGWLKALPNEVYCFIGYINL